MARTCWGAERCGLDRLGKLPLGKLPLGKNPLGKYLASLDIVGYTPIILGDRQVVQLYILGDS